VDGRGVAAHSCSPRVCRLHWGSGGQDRQRRLRRRERRRRERARMDSCAGVEEEQRGGRSSGERRVGRGGGYLLLVLIRGGSGRLSVFRSRPRGVDHLFAIIALRPTLLRQMLMLSMPAHGSGLVEAAHEWRGHRRSELGICLCLLSLTSSVDGRANSVSNLCDLAGAGCTTQRVCVEINFPALWVWEQGWGSQRKDATPGEGLCPWAGDRRGEAATTAETTTA
jgi:hypothetical protein